MGYAIFQYPSSDRVHRNKKQSHLDLMGIYFQYPSSDRVHRNVLLRGGPGMGSSTFSILLRIVFIETSDVVIGLNRPAASFSILLRIVFIETYPQSWAL